MVGFGFNRPSWHTAAFYEAPSIGRLPQSNRDFDPAQWKPRVPNRAFLQARADDQFWAARKLDGAPRRALLRAAVTAGEFGDPASEAFLVRTLAERRDAIARAYLTAVNPIADPVLSTDGTLTFQNVAVDADVARAPQEYRARWFVFDNATGETTSLGETAARSTTLDVAGQPAGARRRLREGAAAQRRRGEPGVGEAGGCLLPDGRGRLAPDGLRKNAGCVTGRLGCRRSRSSRRPPRSDVARVEAWAESRFPGCRERARPAVQGALLGHASPT